jgi:hypothetical protein
MSILNSITTITGVGMWVTPRKLLYKCPRILLELSTFKHQTIIVLLKTEKRPVLTTNRFSLQAGIKPP